ncbi:cyclase family protein [Pseudonocardia parietis]|uniref:Kynurenine formamidase n=1 Tax=Pseudonocardia parietis TaxID=570936 RepID=A0ABS4W5Z7_9PSEU|nr:cyclase family protein [Pseudonocardia parietis]MBP2371626.1 kynurenine formamidase [Pseudonocardia parietis]
MPQRIVDLSLTIDDNMPAHKLFQRPFHMPHLTHEQTSSWGLGTEDDPMTTATAYVSMNDHVGTHVDSFFHVSPTGGKIADMPLDMFMGKAVCFDLTHVPDLGEIDVAEMEAAEKASEVTVDGHIVLLNTGLHRRHYPNPEVCTSNPGVSAEATHWLADRGSKIHGVEGPSTDAPNHALFPNHRVCRDRGLTHYEWLVNLEELVGKGEFMFYGAPLKLGQGTGGLTRAFAVVDD